MKSTQAGCDGVGPETTKPVLYLCGLWYQVQHQGDSRQSGLTGKPGTVYGQLGHLGPEHLDRGRDEAGTASEQWTHELR